MRCFAFRISDWIASRHVSGMDAAEERGYLRLLARAATEPDHGLPDCDHELADISLLGECWFKPSEDPNKRFSRYPTSGSKLRSCFECRDGRLVNIAVPVFGYKYRDSRAYRERVAGRITPAMRREVFERDGYQCVECLSRASLTVDHKQPISKGGRTEPDNLQTLCRPCNSKKGNRVCQ